MNREQWTARAEAYEEAADHLGMSWTEDAEERRQGNIIAQRFRKSGRECRDKADNAS